MTELYDAITDPKLSQALWGLWLGIGLAAVWWVLGAAAERLLVRRERTLPAFAAGLVGRLGAVWQVVQIELEGPSGEIVEPYVVAGLLLLAGGATVLRTASAAERLIASTERPHLAMVTGMGLRYSGAIVLVVATAHVLAYDLTALLATAGVVGVAVGFAAQTSLSNVIAGLFLVVDRPFEVGDTVEVDGRMGTIDEITLLSTYVRTFDNLRVRWPNAWVLDARIVNLTGYPARRLEQEIRVPHGTELRGLRDAVQAELQRCPDLLLEPAPAVRFRDITANGVTLMAYAWIPRDGVLAGRDAMVLAITDTLDRQGVASIVPTYVEGGPWRDGGAAGA